ncbi:MAG: hypothetical protein AAF889_09325 [Cyanobacteria bacterium P01_D01_bin.73]
MTLDSVVSILLEVSTQDGIEGLCFECELLNSEIEGSPETGEYLDCLTWENDDWMLSIGTEDQEMLGYRLPNVEFPEYPIEYSTSKIKLHVAKTPSKTQISFHFVIAYKALPDPENCSTWFAVDIPHKWAKS